MITLRGTVRERVEFSAQTLSRKLKAASLEGMTIGEGVPAPLEKAKTYHRFQVSMREIPPCFYPDLRKKHCRP